MTINKEILDELIKDYKNPEDLLGENGLLKQLTKQLLERAMQAELAYQLGYSKHKMAPSDQTNRRNGTSRKKVKSPHGEFQIEVPRDRAGEFEPVIIEKHQRRFNGFNENIISLYSRGLSTRDIQSHLEEIYGVEVSPDLISSVTEEVILEVREWQNRPLSRLFAIVYPDALRINIRKDGQVKKCSVYVAIGVNLSGRKECLGLWINETEGSKFWLSVLTELKNRGLEDIFICCVDGLKGFSEAIEAVYPQTVTQTCLVQQIRNSLCCVGYKERKAIAAALKPIYTAPSREEALFGLEEFAAKWDARYPLIAKSWRENWSRIEPMFQFTADIRKAIYTTNAIESLNMSLRKIIKTRGSFPSEEACLKLLYLGLKNAAKKWTMPIPNWGLAMNQFAIMFEDRIQPADLRQLTQNS
ncbi:MAG TPA: IS256 family transposase [Pyrinomonadaceae bacterium]|nr:IS256 family transposase [Pyrinomonadaceae bacterium]